MEELLQRLLKMSSNQTLMAENQEEMLKLITDLDERLQIVEETLDRQMIQVARHA